MAKKNNKNTDITPREKATLTSADIVNGLFRLLDENGQPMNLDSNGQIPASAGTEDLITLKEWAIQNGIAPATARQKAGRGALKTARKVGRDWMISRYEPNIDHRSSDGLLSIDGPIHIDEVLNYLLQLDRTTLPDTWNRQHAHQQECRSLFIELRNQFSGNEQLLFDILCDVMARQPDADMYYVSHEDILANSPDRAFENMNLENIDYEDYDRVLTNLIAQMVSHTFKLTIQHNHQVLILPWYQSLTWKRDINDGLYFVPSNFFKLICKGL